jgi:hypothetical protein
MWKHGRKHGFMWLLPGLLIAVSVLGPWHLTYGTILPTSFHVKPPRRIFGAKVWRKFLSTHYGLGLGLALITAYAVSAGIVHMMFGYRMLTPYIGAFAIARVRRRTSSIIRSSDVISDDGAYRFMA